MKVFYMTMGILGIVNGTLNAILHLVSTINNDPEEIRVLRGIQMGIWVLVALIAFVNFERISRK